MLVGVLAFFIFPSRKLRQRGGGGGRRTLSESLLYDIKKLSHTNGSTTNELVGHKKEIYMRQFILINVTHIYEQRNHGKGSKRRWWREEGNL